MKDLTEETEAHALLEEAIQVPPATAFAIDSVYRRDSDGERWVILTLAIQPAEGDPTPALLTIGVPAPLINALKPHYPKQKD